MQTSNITSNQSKNEPGKVKVNFPLVNQNASIVPAQRLIAAAPTTPKPVPLIVFLPCRASTNKAMAIPMNTAPRMFT